MEQTCDWLRREKLDETLRFDFSWEDNLLELGDLKLTAVQITAIGKADLTPAQLAALA